MVIAKPPVRRKLTTSFARDIMCFNKEPHSCDRVLERAKQSLASSADNL